MYPFDDYHRFHRPAAVVATSLGGGKMKGVLDFLQPPAEEAGYSQAELNSIKSHGFTPQYRE